MKKYYAPSFKVEFIVSTIMLSYDAYVVDDFNPITIDQEGGII